jgi:hypothetical protein
MEFVADEAAAMGHRYTEIVVGEGLKDFYRQKLGYYVTDSCILMERPINPSNRPSTDVSAEQSHRKFDFTHPYRPDVYHAAFSNLVALRGSMIAANYRQTDHHLRYPAVPSRTQDYRLRRDDSEGILTKWLTGKMQQIHDPALHEHGVFGWAAFTRDGLETVKLLGEEAQQEPRIWSPLRGDPQQGTYYVRSSREEERGSAILPAKLSSNDTRVVEQLDDTPSNLNILIAVAQSVERAKITALQ